MKAVAEVGWGMAGALFVLFLLAPLGLVILFSFTDRTISNFPINALSLQWWSAMLANPQFLPALEEQPHHRRGRGRELGGDRHDGGDGLCAAAAAPLGPRHRSPLPAADAAAAGAGRVASQLLCLDRPARSASAP